jgi:cobalt-precorrin 5A hydrolase/precorrin-3B C17-methyltransferase
MALNPIILYMNRAGFTTAEKISKEFSLKLHGRKDRVDVADVLFDNALNHIRELFSSGTPVIGVCASGILIRAVAPLLRDKSIEPPLIAVSDDSSVVVPLLGGHRGANRLAVRIASFLEAKAAVTTAGEVALGIALDEPPEGWCLDPESDAKAVMAKLLSGGGVQKTGAEVKNAHWLSVLPSGTDVKILCTTEINKDNLNSDVIFYPKMFSLGVGCSRDCPPQELKRLVNDALLEANVNYHAVHSINTLDLKADEPAILDLANDFGIPLRLFTSEELEQEAHRLKSPSEVVFKEVGCHGVSEGAALAQVGNDGFLSLNKKKTKNATCALAVSNIPLVDFRGRSRGRLSLVGIGPGQAEWRTPEASVLIGEAEEIIGYSLYLDLLGPVAAGKKRTDFSLGDEEKRCRYALERAAEGANVALICSGDSGIYAMGALVFELLDRGSRTSGVSLNARKVEVISTPGVSALQAAAARSGAPLGNDFCAISLSDLLTPKEDIIKRLNAASNGDFVVALYNPVSRRRKQIFEDAREIFLKNRPEETPVLLASSLGRPKETIRYTTLLEVTSSEIDMLTVVIVGSSKSRVVKMGDGLKMYTPRGYSRKITDS